MPAVADGHVTIIRVDHEKINPYYLADYLRVGVGAAQIERLYTGSTGLIELAPEDVERIYVAALDNIKSQSQASKSLRTAEAKYSTALDKEAGSLNLAREKFSELTK